MSFDADLTACAAVVERSDPVRFRATMAAPVAARAVLFPIYAFNIEVSRAPWLTQEPMIAEMRLQWWRDVCDEIAEGKPVRRHQVATPLAKVVPATLAPLLEELVAARRWDIYKDAFDDAAHFARYMDQTAGHLTFVAARCLGAAQETTLRDAAHAVGIAAWLCAIPELEARGRIPLIDGTREAVASLAQGGLTRLRQARAQRSTVSKPARAALLHLGQAQEILELVAKDPGAVSEGRLPDPADLDRFGLGYRVISGRW